ncbi:MAG: ATP synthase F1 subunit delta [Phycisphaerae bacterium]|nr:ATP synthase F1 subunit delta [Phycisphaerae bacterium]
MPVPADTVMQPRLAALANTYAQALLDNVPDNERAEELAGELDEIVRLLDGIEGFDALLTRAMLTRTQRDELVQRVFAGRVSEPVEAFVTVLGRRNRLEVIRPAAMKFRQLLNIRKGLLEVHATTSAPLDEKRRAEIAEMISGQLGSEIILIAHVDEDMLGGIVIRVGDRVFNASLAASIEKLSNRLARRIALAAMPSTLKEDTPE